MISFEKRFLFIHIPKTAGNSIQDQLRGHAVEELVAEQPYQDGVERFELRAPGRRTHKHSTLAEYEAAYGTDVVASLFKFSCVRNPWERAISYYFSPHRGVVGWQRQAFVELLPDILPAKNYLTANPYRSDLESAVAGIDRILRYEELESGFTQVCARLGIPAKPLPTRNRSKHHHYREYYDPELIGLVREKFVEEIELFGYSF